MSTTTDTAEIRSELAALSRRVAAIECRLSENGNALHPALDSALMAKVREVTAQIFAGKCDFTDEFDPEYPDDRYVVVNVVATGDPQQIVDRTCEWHERIRSLSAELAGVLRLSVVPN
jgi:hypothetical protein